MAAARYAGRLSVLFAGLSGLVGMGIFIFATPASAWFWQNSATLRQLQFPWRLLDLALLLLALASAWWAAILRPNWRTWLLGAALALMYLNAVPYLYPARLDALPRRPTLADASRIQKEQGVVGLTAWGEYSSAAVDEVGRPALPAPTVARRFRREGAATRLCRATRRRRRRPGSYLGPLHAGAGDGDARRATSPAGKPRLTGIRCPHGLTNRAASRLACPQAATRWPRWARTPVRWLADALSFLALGTAGWLSLRPGAFRAGVAPSNSAVPGPVLLVLIALLVLKWPSST